MLFVVDAMVGATSTDEQVVRLLRKSGKPVFLVANKVDDARQEPEAAALWNLGLGEPHPVSAIHGRGVADLLDEVMKVLPDVSAVAKQEIGGPRRVAILGRPNVGKSSLLNKAAGEERVVVNELAGTTRDPVDEQVELGGKLWRFVDTAGIRRRVHLQQGADFYASLRTSARAREGRSRRRRARRLASRSASRTCASSTSCSSRAARSCSRSTSGTSYDDDLENADRRRYLEREIEQDLAHVAWAPRVNISAPHRSAPREARAGARDWRSSRGTRRIPTGKFNAFLAELVAEHPHPVRGGKQPRILFGTQASTRPPTFVLFTTGFLDPGYRRYIQRRLREIYGFEGTPDRHQHARAREAPALMPRRSPSSASALAAGPDHRRRVWRPEAELLVEPVRVGGEEHPAEVATGTVVDHALHELLSEGVSAVLGKHEDVREIGESDPVRRRSCEPDLSARVGAIGADDPPRRDELGLDIGTRAPASPVRVCRQVGPHHVWLDARRVIVEFVVHAPILARRRMTATGPIPSPWPARCDRLIE